MAHKNSDNTGERAGIALVSVDLRVEMEAFDQLGPATRHALNDAPFEFSAARVLDQAENLLINPKGPGGDACLANSVERAVKQSFGAPISAFRLRPDRGRRRLARLR